MEYTTKEFAKVNRLIRNADVPMESPLGREILRGEARRGNKFAKQTLGTVAITHADFKAASPNPNIEAKIGKRLEAIRKADDAKLAAGCAVTCDGASHSPYCPTHGAK